MFSNKTRSRKLWAIALASFLICAVMSSAMTAFADTEPGQEDQIGATLTNADQTDEDQPGADEPGAEQGDADKANEPVIEDTADYAWLEDLDIPDDCIAVDYIKGEVKFDPEAENADRIVDDFLEVLYDNQDDTKPYAENYNAIKAWYVESNKESLLNDRKSSFDSEGYFAAEIATAFLAEVGEYDDAAVYSENYKAISEWAVGDGYTTLLDYEGFDENLEKAVAVKKLDVKHFNSWLALLPPIIAIGLALITKEVYSSLFIGIISGALLYSNFSFTGTLDHAFTNGFVASVADSYNIGIIIFLVVLGAIVVLMNHSGGSAAFGRWATTHIKSKVGAQIATILLGVLIFVDDYFNCLTVGSVMRPVTDKFKVSRAKLAYIIDATAAPVCIIAPVSSWAAAVAGFVSEEQIGGFELFLRAIPYNFYALLTIAMMIVLVVTKFDFGPMRKHEANAENGDLFSSADAEMFKAVEDADTEKKGIVWDLLAPVIVLIVGCILGLLYSGGFFGGDAHMDFINAFSSADASVGLVLGSFAGLIFSVIYFLCRRVLTFKQCMEAIPEGFKAMVPAIMILACAWTLKTMTDSLGAKVFIAEFVRNYATEFIPLIPAIVFLIAVGLSFATGTSWGTFGILIPIVLAVFGGSIDKEISIIAISACMAGAVCGDHCSPISDTTIMASAGSQSNHINHVSTQLPYALTTAAVSFVCYLAAGFVATWLPITTWYIMLPVGIVVMVGTLLVLKLVLGKKKA